MSPNKMTLKQKIKLFVRRNLYPIVVSASAFALAIALTVTALVRSKIMKEEAENKLLLENQEQTKIEKAEAASPAVVVFDYPVKNYSLGDTFSDKTLAYNKTLNEWKAHLGIDFIVSDGADVYPCYKGKVESIDFSTLDGTTIVINHGNNFRTIYKSLAKDAMVEVGDEVSTSDVIGKASSSAAGEAKLGSHIHLEVKEGDTFVNPMNYLGEK